MIGKLCLIQVMITIQKLLLNTAVRNNNFLELNQTNYNLTIWIQLFTSLIDDIKQNYIFTILEIKDDYESHFTLQMLMQNNNFRFVVIANNIKENFGIDIINQNYQWIAFTLASEDCLFNHHIWYPYKRNIIPYQLDCRKAKIITTYTEIVTLLVYDEYQENVANHYFIIDQFPFFDKHQFTVQNDQNLIDIIAYARIISDYEYKGFYITQFIQKNSAFILIYEDQKFYLASMINKIFKPLLSYTYQIKMQVWLMYRITFQQNQFHIQLEIDDFQQKGMVDMKVQEKYVNQIIYQLYNQGAIHQKVLIVHKYAKKDDQIEFCYPGCSNCQGFQCLDQQQELLCGYVEFYNEQTEKCQLMVTQPFLEVTQDLFTPRCKVGLYLENRKCIQCPSYQGVKCLECLINTNNWREERICVFSQIVYLQLISQLFQRQGNIDYNIEDDHYSQSRRYNFLQNNEFQNIFLAQSKDIYLTYYDYITNKQYCQVGYTFQNHKCIQNKYNCLFQQKQSFICKSGYIELRNQCLRCQRFCKFCQFQNKTLICIISQENYQIVNSLIRECQNQSQCVNSVIKCDQGQFYDPIDDKCMDKNLTYIQQNLIQYMEYINMTQGKGLNYILQNQSTLSKQSAIQLRYLSVIEQLHMPISYAYKNQNNILDCELTVYYRNNPYCLKPVNNYLVNNFNQLLYCPVSRYCGYKYIVDCKVQITNKAIIIINNQIYNNFSQVIESINKKIIEIKIVEFNVLFQINQYNLELDWGKLFYLEDAHYNQNITKYAINIQFQYSSYFLNNCDRILIRFHYIILNGLNISLGEQCNRKHDNQYFQIELIGPQLILNNTNFFNQKQPLTIFFRNFTYVIILNTKTHNCTIAEEFLFNFDINNDDGIITIKNTIIQYSNLAQFFIKISGVKQFKLVDFMITRSSIFKGIIFVPLIVKNFNILNMMFRYVYGFEACMLALYSQISPGNMTASDINFYNCDFHKTTILLVKQSINIQQLQFASTRFNISYIILSERAQFISISQFKLQNLTIIDSYIILVKTCKQIIIESLIISYKLDSSFTLFDIESSTCTFQGVRLNNLHSNFSRNLFLFQRQQWVVIQDLFIQGNVNQTSCHDLNSQQIKHLFQMNSVSFVGFQNVQLQSCLFCDLGFIHAECDKVVIRFFELRNSTLNLIKMHQSFIYFQAKSTKSRIDIENFNINQVYIMLSVQHTLLQYVGFSATISVVNFEIQDVNTTFRSYIFGVSNLYFILEQFYGYNLRSLSILKSDNCHITLNSSIIQKVYDLTNYSIPLLYIVSNQYNQTYVQIFNVKVYELINQFVFLQPFSKQNLFMKNIQINIEMAKTDIISFGTYKQKHQQTVQISNIVFNIKNYNIKLQYYLLNITSKTIEISNITVNTLTIGFLNAISSSIKVWNISINNPGSLYNNMFNLNQQDLQSMIILSNIIITSQINSVLKSSCIFITQRNSKVIIQNILVQNILQHSIIHIFQLESEVQNQFKKNIIRNSVFNNLSLEISIIQASEAFKIHMEQLHFIKIQTKELFFGVQAQFDLMKSQIINSTSNQAQVSANLKIQKSCLVDGQILLSNIRLNQTYVLNRIQDVNDKYQSKELQLFLSLNEGKSYFKNQIKDYDHYVIFSQDNQYLYLPSGQLLQQFIYLNVKQQLYQQLYESISFVVKYTKQDNTFNCQLQQQINGSQSSQIEIVLKFGVNVMNNLTFTLNPYYNQTLQNTLSCNYDEDSSNLTFFVKTFPCQLGEYLFQHQCLVCDIEKNYYSVSYKSTNCLIKDNQKIDLLKKGQIQLLPNYWRYQLHNKYIEKCSNNCKGGWKVGDNSCIQGYIGAICQECDIYNIRGQGQYGLDGNKCQICSFDYTLIIKGLFISFWQILLAYMSYTTNTQISNQFLFNKINNRRLSNVLDRQNINQVSIIIKLISNYLYSLYVIKDNFYLGNYIDWSLNLFNNPNMIISPQLDCMLAKLTPIDVSYSMLIYRFATPFIVLNMFFVIFIILIFLKQTKYETKVVLIIIYSIYIFNQQIILQSLIKQSSYKLYSNIAWVYQNLSRMYYSDNHLNMLYKLVIPLSIFFWIIPFTIFLYLRKINRISFKSQKVIGYIYREYNQNCYYWEMIRIYYNFLLMTILYVFNQKLFLTLILCQTFLLLTQYKKPYSLNNLNRIDQYILIYAQFSFILIFFGEKENDILIRFTIIVICNILLLQYLIRQILSKVNFAYEKDIVFIQQKLVNKFPQMSKYLDLEKREQIKSKIKKLRSSVKLRSFTTQSPTVQSPDVISKPTIVLEGEIEMQQIETK